MHARFLVPKKPDGKHPTYEEFCQFIEPFTQTDDYHVNRFIDGELRLTRINRAALLFAATWPISTCTCRGAVMSRILAPVVTVFAIFHRALNSMAPLQALDMAPAATSRAGTAWCRSLALASY